MRLIRYPWIFWDFSFLFLLISIYLTYIIITEKMYFISFYIYSTHFVTIGMNVLLYYIWFFMIYVAKIERVTIDKKVY